ncbi:MAG: lysostaphin resistance A-like protein [Anaerolineae bacterium]
MSHQSALFRKEDVKSPAILLFGAVYVFAVVLALLSDPSQALVYVGLSLGILLLVWLIIGLTERVQIEDIQIRRPGLELVFGCLVYLISKFVRFPQFEFGRAWSVSSILRNQLFFFILPFVFLRLRKNSLLSMGLSLCNWKQNLKVAAIILTCMAIPSTFFISDTARLLLGRQLGLAQAVPGFFVLFIRDVALAGLPEEFFFRAFVQTRLSKVLQSRLSGLLLTAFLFGLIHVDNIMRWYPDTTLPEAFCRAFFIQGFTGLVFGVLWERTRNLIPGIMVHSGINALNNLGSITSFL